MLICVAKHASIFQANLAVPCRVSGLEWEDNLAQGTTFLTTQSLSST